jgi:hypothetical protein
MIREALLKQVRGSRKTLYRISRDTGINHTALTRFVTGDRPDIRISTADKLADYFGLSLQTTSGKRK